MVNYKLKVFLLLILAAFVWASLKDLFVAEKMVFFGNGSVLYKSSSVNILFDTGASLHEIASLLGYFGRVDAVVLSHCDQDHAKNAQEIASFYKADIYTSPYCKKDFKNSKKLFPGDAVEFAQGYFIVLWPTTKQKSSNDNSLVIFLQTSSKSFLLPGDISSKVERALVFLYKNKLSADYLLAPHHGSKSSLSEEFLAVVNPERVIVTGAKKRYLHPSKEALSRISNLKIKTEIIPQNQSLEIVLLDSKAKRLLERIVFWLKTVKEGYF